VMPNSGRKTRGFSRCFAFAWWASQPKKESTKLGGFPSHPQSYFLLFFCFFGGKSAGNHGFFSHWIDGWIIWCFPTCHGGTPSHHPFLFRIFHETNQPAIVFSPWNPTICNQWIQIIPDSS
jgi:hypothetical protein